MWKFMENKFGKRICSQFFYGVECQTMGFGFGVFKRNFQLGSNRGSTLMGWIKAEAYRFRDSLGDDYSRTYKW